MPILRPAARHAAAAASLPSNRVLCNLIGSITRAVDRVRSVFSLPRTPLTAPFEDDTRVKEKDAKRETRVNILVQGDRATVPRRLRYYMGSLGMILHSIGTLLLILSA